MCLQFIGDAGEACACARSMQTILFRVFCTACCRRPGNTQPHNTSLCPSAARGGLEVGAYTMNKRPPRPVTENCIDHFLVFCGFVGQVSSGQVWLICTVAGPGHGAAGGGLTPILAGGRLAGLRVQAEMTHAGSRPPGGKPGSPSAQVSGFPRVHALPQPGLSSRTSRSHGCTRSRPRRGYSRAQMQAVSSESGPFLQRSDSEGHEEGACFGRRHNKSKILTVRGAGWLSR